MKPLNTFYDTLQVSRSANESVMRAAYKTLCQKYHPDKNPDDVDGATQDMLLLNKAYEVLSDPGKRLEYDLWITKRERDMRAQAEREAAEAQARKPMFPPIEMPPAAPDAPPSASATSPKVPPTPAPKPVPAAPSTTAAWSRRQDFAPTTVEDQAGQSEFADTQPQAGDGAAASQTPAIPAIAAVSRHIPTIREPVHQSPLAQGVDWLRERPVWLIFVVLAAVLLLAFTPWLWHASFGKAKPLTPITPDLQPTYVEPAAVPALEPASAPVALPLAVPQEPPAARADNPARTAKATRAAAARRASATPKKAPEPEAPVQHSQPAPASVPLDPGGHTGFAPKCRWVTPTRWSCD